MTYLMTSEFHSYVDLEVLYMFLKDPTSFLSFVQFLNFCKLFIILGFNHVYRVLIFCLIDLVGIFQIFYSGNYIL